MARLRDNRGDSSGSHFLRLHLETMPQIIEGWTAGLRGRDSNPTVGKLVTVDGVEVVVTTTEKPKGSRATACPRLC